MTKLTDEEIQALIEENNSLKEEINIVTLQQDAVDSLISKIKESYYFFRSQLPGSSMVLGDNTVIVFEANTQVTSRDRRTGKVVNEEAWGQYYTKSPEIAEEIRQAAKHNTVVREMYDAEVDYVLEGLRASSSTNK